MSTDLRYALRRLRNNPIFALVAIATLAIAIGANTAMFSFVQGMLLRPLPYPEPDQIVRVLERLPTGGPNGISTLNYLDWSKQNTVFEYIAAEAGWHATLSGGAGPILLRGARVSPHYFDIFGATVAQGRTFRPDEDQPGRDHVVLLSHSVWAQRFGADPAILERNIDLNGELYAVVGVLPEDGPFARTAAQVWAPLSFRASDLTRDFRWLAATARLKSGVTLTQARAGMDAIGWRLASAYPESNKGWGVAVDRLGDVVIGSQSRTAVTALFAATVFVLVIGGANLANLARAAGISRSGEMAVRAALGASRGHLIRQLLIENVVIALCGAAGAIAVAGVMIRWIQSLIPPGTLPPAVEISMNPTVVLFAVFAAVSTGLLFGLAPATQATGHQAAGTLKEAGNRATAGASTRRMSGGLVIAEIALAFVLLVSSGLLIRTFVRLLHVDPGFDANNVLTASLPTLPEQHPDPRELNGYLASLRAAIDNVPGVRQTALTSALPLEGSSYGTVYAIADRAPADQVNRQRAFLKIVSPSYGDTLGIRMRLGRKLSDQDSHSAPHVALINETLANREFPDGNPVGHRILIREPVPGRVELGRESAWEIVGVIAGEKITGLGDEISAGIYVSNQQIPSYGMNLIVRTDRPPQSLQTAIQSAVVSVNKNQALGDVRTLEQIVRQSALGNRVVSTLFAAFAAIALLLAALGIYGVMSYTAAQRRVDMGIRAALGASAADLRWLILREGMRLAAIGLAIGLAATLAVTRVMSSILFDVDPQDPLTIAVVAILLAAVAGLACLVPAWRMTKVDPMEVLRNQ